VKYEAKKESRVKGKVKLVFSKIVFEGDVVTFGVIAYFLKCFYLVNGEVNGEVKDVRNRWFGVGDVGGG
jgi:hypothetical protein